MEKKRPDLHFVDLVFLLFLDKAGERELSNYVHRFNAVIFKYVDNLFLGLDEIYGLINEFAETFNLLGLLLGKLDKLFSIEIFQVFHAAYSFLISSGTAIA